MTELPGGERAALPSWSPGAFKVGARERWLGWPPERQFRRLHLIASNTQFLVSPAFRVPNLASRAPGLSAKCLSSDMEALRRHPVLLVETFVDPALFVGTYYLAAGWREIRETRSFGRNGVAFKHQPSGCKLAMRTVPSLARAGLP